MKIIIRYDKKPWISTPCLACGEAVPIVNPKDAPEICEKCKAAIIAMREQIDGERKNDNA